MSSKLLGQVARLTLKTSKLRAEIERLQGLFDKWHTIAAEKHAEIERHIREKVELAGLVAKERARIERLQALLKRHDDLCRKDEAVGNDYVWTPELQELVEDTRAALSRKEDQTDVNSKEAELWSETMRLKSAVDHRDAVIVDLRARIERLEDGG